MSLSLWQALRQSPTTALVILVCTVDSVTIAYDGSLMGSLNVMPSYINYFTLTTSTTAVNTCATFLGAILIGPFTGKLIDWQGRKIGIYAAAIVNIIGAIIAAVSQNIATFIAGRMIIGIGVGLGQTAAGTYVGETTPPAVRPFALGLYFSCWAVGSLIAAGVSYGVSFDAFTQLNKFVTLSVILTRAVNMGMENSVSIASCTANLSYHRPTLLARISTMARVQRSIGGSSSSSCAHQWQRTRRSDSPSAVPRDC